MGSNIYIISDETDLAEELKTKIVLLRKNDDIVVLDFNKATTFNFSYADLVLIYPNEEDASTKIKGTTFNQSLDCVTRILITDKYDENLIFDAFDMGINDFVSPKAQQGHILLKIMSGLKSTQLRKKIFNQNEILASMKIIDKENNFFTQVYMQQAFAKEFLLINQKAESAIFLEISVDIKYKNILPISLLASAIKKAIRKEDIAGFAADNKINLILHNTDEHGAKSVFAKIKNNLNESYSISGAATEITNENFNSTEKTVAQALANALIKGASYVFVSKKTTKNIENWLDKSDLKESNFMIFKQSFISKFTKITAPIFFQKQTILQNKLFETNVSQSITDEESRFSIKHSDIIAELLIKYPGYAKINIEIAYKQGIKTTKERIAIDIAELTQTKLENIIDKMVNKFQEIRNEN